MSIVVNNPRQAASDVARQLVANTNPPWNAPIRAWPSKELEAHGQAVAVEALSKLPKVPNGFYIVPCDDPDVACIGWHCYMYGGWLKEGGNGDPYLPTGQHYCDGQSALTLAWATSQLADLPEDDQGNYIIDPAVGPLLTNGKPVLSLIE